MRHASLSIFALFGLFACVACEPLCVARGRVVDVDGLTGARCAVRLHRRAGEPEQYGSPCRPPNVAEGDPDRWVVKLGQDFECSTIPGLKGEALEVVVSCDGYEPYRGSPFEWKVEGLTCRSHAVGVIALRRTREEPAKTHEE